MGIYTAASSNATCDMISNTVLPFKVNAGILLAVNIVLGFAGLALNLVVVVSLLSSQLRKKLCYFMIFILSCFDILLVVLAHPALIVDTLNVLFEIELYSMEWYYFIPLSALSLTALFTTTLERYLALVYPFFHHKFVTKSRLIVILALMQIPFWTPFFAFKSKSATSYIKRYYIGLHTGVLLVMFILNRKIYILVEGLRQRADVPMGNLVGSEQQRNIAKKRKVRLGKVSTCLLAVLCSSLCFFPTLIFLGVDSESAKDGCVPLEIEHNWILLWAKTFLAMNSTLNSLIFFYKNSVLRRRGNEVIAKGFSVFKRLLRRQ